MAGFDFESLTDGLRTVFLAGVGAVASSAEKSKEVIDELVRKGELTVDQGKALNTELSRKAADGAKSAMNGAREVFNDTRDSVMRARLRAMSEQERKDYIARLTELSAQLDSDAESNDESQDKSAQEPSDAQE